MGLPAPVPELDDAPFWQGCRERELRIQRCRNCGKFRHMPSPLCASCKSFDTEWVVSSGRGTVFTYTIAYTAAHPAVREALPYNIASILLDDAGDVRLMSNVVDARPDEMKIGLPVELHWDAMGDGMYLPRFKKRVA